MTLRLVQKGTGAARPLVVAFLVGEFLDEKLRKALGPAACIVADGSAHGTEMMAQIVEFAHRAAGFEGVAAVALVGYSMGCQRVRTLRRAGAEASALLLIDGTHASWPPETWQIAWLSDLADRARTSKTLLIATHTLQTYTEVLTPPQTPFASTVTVLRMATGMPLDQAGPLDAPVLSRDGNLYVYSYRSAPIDAPAHGAQLTRVLPELATRHLQSMALFAGSRMLLIGDSLAVGLATPLKRLATEGGAHMASHAMEGTTIDQWSRGNRLADALAHERPTRTLISLGTNDMLSPTIEAKAPAVRAIVDRVLAAGSDVVWIVPPLMPFPDRGLRALLYQELTPRNVPLFPSELFNFERAPDKVHMTPRGYADWARMIWKWLPRPSSNVSVSYEEDNTLSAERRDTARSAGGLGVAALAGLGLWALEG